MTNGVTNAATNGPVTLAPYPYPINNLLLLAPRGTRALNAQPLDDAAAGLEISG